MYFAGHGIEVDRVNYFDVVDETVALYASGKGRGDGR
jgi:hypothetical protein